MNPLSIYKEARNPGGKGLSFSWLPGFLIKAILCAVVCVGAYAAEDAVKLSADMTRWSSDDKVTAAGNVQASYRDFTVTADSAEADLNTNIAVFHGKVKLSTKQNTVEGEELTLNLKTKEWSLNNASSSVRIQPLQALQGGLQYQSGQTGPTGLTGQTNQPSPAAGIAYLQSSHLSGDENNLKLETGTLTTCDLEHPHYYFSARELEIYPNSRIIAHGVSMNVLGKNLFSLGVLVIPIKGLSRNIFPQFGSSAEEGAFLKTSYAYMATENAQGFLKLDLMQQRGIGAGIDHSLTSSNASTKASLYFLADRQIGGNNVTGRLQHQQKFGSIGLNLTGDYRTNNYLYYPSSTSQNWQLALDHITSKANTSLSFRNNATRGFGTNETMASSLRHTQQFSDKLSAVFSMDERAYNSTGMTAADRELNSEFEIRQRDDKYDLSLTASKRVDLDGSAFLGDNFYSNLDRLPELTFTTDSYRMGKGFLFGLPSRITLSAGRYHEMPTDVSKNRLLFQWDMPGQTLDIGSKNELNLNAGFRQAYYAGDMMQHVLKLGGMLTTRYNDYLKTRLSYNYQTSNGYSPFRFDYTGKYNYLRWVMDYQDEKALRWSLSSGYNLEQSQFPWQDIALRLTAHPNDYFAYSISSGYDMNRGRWRTLTNQIRILKPGALGLELGTRYDMATGKLGLARGRIDLQIGSKWRLEGITSWNGSLKKFDYQSYRITRDLHCWEVSLGFNNETGFRRDVGINLEFRIKAFQTADRFGIGQFGQAVDTSLGDYYY